MLKKQKYIASFLAGILVFSLSANSVAGSTRVDTFKHTPDTISVLNESDSGETDSAQESEKLNATESAKESESAKETANAKETESTKETNTVNETEPVKETEAVKETESQKETESAKETETPSETETPAETETPTEPETPEVTTPTEAELFAELTVSMKSAKLLTRSSMQVSWKKCSDAEGYYLYRILADGSYKLIKKITSGATTSYKVTGLTYGNTYRFTVRAYRTIDGKLCRTKKGGSILKKKLKVKLVRKKKYSWYYDLDDNKIENPFAFYTTKDYYLKVNLTSSVMTIYGKDGNKGYRIPLKAYLCAGNVNDATGTWSLGQKYRYKTLYYSSYSQWSVRVHGAILLHCSPYVKSCNPNSLDVKEYNKLGTPASHGCIRLQCVAIKWVYDMCSSKTKVTFYKSSNPGPLGKPELEKLKSWHTWDPTDPTMAKYCKKKNCKHKTY